MNNNRNKMLGTVVLGAAAFLLRNKESREKLKRQFESMAGSPKKTDTTFK